LGNRGAMPAIARLAIKSDLHAAYCNGTGPAIGRACTARLVLIVVSVR
jgi:hypothetical protein